MTTVASDVASTGTTVDATGNSPSSLAGGTLPVRGPRYSPGEFARRGNEWYDQTIKPLVEPHEAGKFIAIDIETGAFEVSDDELVALDRLFERRAEAQPWLRRVGIRHTYVIGAGASVTPP